MIVVAKLKSDQEKRNRCRETGGGILVQQSSYQQTEGQEAIFSSIPTWECNYTGWRNEVPLWYDAS